VIGFLKAVKADLLDRRLLPLVGLVVFVLVAAVGYAMLSGGSTSTPAATVATAPPITAGAGLSISHATPETAVAEVTSGASTQHRGVAHDPFIPLPNPAEKTASSASATGSTTSSSASSSSSSSGSSESSASSESTPSSPSSSSTPTTPSKSSTPAKPKTVYHVAVLFGELPPAGSTSTAQLTPYENLKLLTPLPSAKQAVVVFRGVTAGGKSATFTLVGEAILHGKAACLPNASQCEAIDLHVGESEIFEYLTSSGQTVSDELTLVTITSTKGSSADVANVLRGESKSGRALLRNDGLLALPDLRSSSQVGVLVFAGKPAFAHASSRAGGHAHSGR
jgi:hypothetical protein